MWDTQHCCIDNEQCKAEVAPTEKYIDKLTISFGKWEESVPLSSSRL